MLKVILVAATIAVNTAPLPANISPDDQKTMQQACATDTSDKAACESNVYWYIHRGERMKGFAAPQPTQK